MKLKYLETGEEVCAKCPEFAKACYYNSDTKKIVIKKGDCESSYYVEKNEVGDYCKKCPILSGCTQCDSPSTCIESDFN